MPEEPEKGVAGENTGGKARSEIKKAKARGATNETIGKAVKRDPDTIRNIESGNIENPPADVVKNISEAKSAPAGDQGTGGHMSVNDYAASLINPPIDKR